MLHSVGDQTFVLYSLPSFRPSVCLPIHPPVRLSFPILILECSGMALGSWQCLALSDGWRYSPFGQRLSTVAFNMF